MTAASNPLNDINEINRQIHAYDTAKGKLDRDLGNYPTIFKPGKGFQDAIKAKVDKNIIEALAEGIATIQETYQKKCDANDTPTLCQKKIIVCRELISQLTRLYQTTYGGKRKTSKGYSKRIVRKRKNTKRNRKYRSPKA
jgi:hypothetical protein